MSVGVKIREARKIKGFTLKELGDLINIKHSSLSQIETGVTNPSKRTLISLAKVLNDNFGLDWLNEHLTSDTPKSKKEIAQEMSVEELISLKFGGTGETKTRAQMRALAQLLDAEIAKETRIMGYPESKKK